MKHHSFSLESYSCTVAGIGVTFISTNNFFTISNYCIDIQVILGVIQSIQLLKLITFYLQVRHGRFKSSPLISDDPTKYTKFEVSRSPEEWKHVQNLLPKEIIPEPQPKPDYPSGWRPQEGNFINDKILFFFSKKKRDFTAFSVMCQCPTPN